MPEAAAGEVAGAQPWTASTAEAASATDPTVVRAQILRCRCVTLRQNTGFARPFSHARRGCGQGLRYSRRLAGMAGTDPADEIAGLTSKLASIEAVLDPGAMQTEVDSLREQAADPGLWADQDRAQKVHRRLSYLEAELARLDGLNQRLSDTQVLFELAAEGDGD